MRGQRFLLMAFLLALLAGLAPVAMPAASAQDPGGRICVLAFHDANVSGVRDPIEPLIADVVVSIQTDQAVVIANYVTTGQTEPYCFSGLGPGTYAVHFVGGAVAPTGQSTFGVTLAAGQTLPAQVQFGAVPADAAATAAAVTMTATTSPSSSSETTTLRVIFALGGAGLVVVLFLALGMIVYWLRYRN